MACFSSTRLEVLCGLVAFMTVGRAAAAPLTDSAFGATIDHYCVSCHDAATKKGDLDLETLVAKGVTENSPAWEKALRMIEARQMPPIGKKRPTDDGYGLLSDYLVNRLDASAAKNPNAGRVDTFRRLNRTEYQNAIRDLLALEIDASSLLPADESSHGFDHITVGDLSPALLTRYVQAAQKISRLAVGSPLKRPDGATYRIKPDTTQESHVPGLPLGTRGGANFRHTFPRDGEYEIQIRLTRDRNDEVEGLSGTHQLEILLDKERVAGLVVSPPKNRRAADFDDSKLNARVKVEAGPRDLGVTFIDNGESIEETKRQPLNVHFNLHRHPRLSPAIYQVSITGPFSNEKASDETGDTPSRRRIFVSLPGYKQDAAAAKKTLARFARLAYRRSVDDADVDRLMGFFDDGQKQGGFDAGIEAALSAILTSPSFLLKIEREPKEAMAGKAYEISQVELASRLSFFLWSSIPDDELLALAEHGKLRQADVLEAQVKRMLADEKASTLATNFASQWLHLRNLDSITPDGRLFPDFDDNLRQAMRKETELHVRELLKSDRGVLDLIRTDHTYLNERLAKHYGIPHVYGSRFRRVDLPPSSQRGGLLRQGSILTVTSYATRTSPVIRGNWILENILGSPAPPPPQDVPSLDESAVIAADLTVRQRLNKHREDPSCASCHNLMDPVGFSLENFDAVGRWRDLEAGRPVDAAGGLPDGSRFTGVAGLEEAILKRPSIFVTAMTERLLTFGLGRGVELSDGPALRQVVRAAANDDYKLSAIVLGIVRSVPFQMRNAQ
ncbi:MAG: DUF1592 domain-containing protein [Phycisphaeraceae bacterium]